MTRVKLEHITKVFGPVIAADDINLETGEGEFFALLGPSGCGKTTTLRIIAGFEVPDKGKVYFDDEDVTYLKPNKRNTAMVFQNYALWPHMTVYDNVAYGLKLRRKELELTDEEIDKMVKDALRLVKLEGMEKRYPLQLSGGQQQRVALARALVVKPRVLLLDEPLSNLDAKLRIEMREELKKLQRTLGLTTIYVTHDQIEAMSLSDRLAVMNKGRIEQIGAPQELYLRPKTLFVADFLGRSTIYPGELVGKDEDSFLVKLEGGDIVVRGVSSYKNLPKKVAVVIRPEVIKYSSKEVEEKDVVAKGMVEFAMFVGEKVEAKVKISNELSLLAYFSSISAPPVGKEVELVLPWRNIIILPLQ